MTILNTEIPWHLRELERFSDGTYKLVPVSLDYPATHFVHLSVTTTESDYIAYTPSDAYGIADRQIRLKFGRYLKKTFASLTDADIQSFVTCFKSAVAVADKPAQLHFATDRETINRIFETEMYACGASCASCMYNKFDGDEIRPYHVYADSPDVAVAYVTCGEKIIARSVVSTKRKEWVRAYAAADGDNDTACGTLKQLLSDAGYSKGDLEGCRLTKLDTRGVMLPYIDNNGAQVRDRGDYWLVVSDCGDYEADCTDGTVTEINKCGGCGHHQDDCECIYCECCQESFVDGCDDCNMCEDCGRCSEHNRCRCDRRGDCDRLTRDCDCERCDDCHELTDNCECESEPEETETETEPVVIPAIAAETDPVTPDDARYKLNSAWCYLREQSRRDLGFTANVQITDTPAMRLIRAAFELVSRMANEAAA